MIKIGLTGGIGSGKSSVAKLVQQQGIPIIDADQISHRLLENDGEAYDQVRLMFGAGVVNSHGEIDRRALGELVFSDASARRSLEDLLHPLIIKQIQAEVVEKAAQGANLLVIEMPLLFEAKLQKMFDLIWVVNINQEQQLERLRMRDGLTEIEAKRRINTQLPLDMKVKKADVVIENQGNLSELAAQVNALLSKYK